MNANLEAALSRVDDLYVRIGAAANEYGSLLLWNQYVEELGGSATRKARRLRAADAEKAAATWVALQRELDELQKRMLEER